MTDETTPIEPVMPESAPPETPPIKPVPSAEEPYRPPIETPEPAPVEASPEPMPAEAAAPPETVMVEVAILDENDVFQGTMFVEEALLTDAHVRLDCGCDLPPDAYRWDRDRKTFVHCGPAAQRAETAPNTLNAVAWGFLAVRQAGIALPAKTLRWLDWYTATIDFLGTNENGAEHELVVTYRRERGLK